MLTKADKWLIVALTTLSITGIGLNLHYMSSVSGQARSIVVTVAGKTVKTFPLRQGYVGEYRIDGHDGYNIIEYQGGRVRMKEADCPDQICVQQGWISIPPQQIVCLPNRVVVKVISDNPADIDDIVR
ncbi:NusG domain II-containing protein [Sporomusa acidovorans]|uniref:NusG domain-containing protein n=1 Tax=Sporomusa acidovorans (strain ATCC 49682 / DSM 3132 / Mol) TaxID=1123286 RepID=A0ABZ3J1V1_SPOA4|nr:NusG domain II-containing protein [Sporomusa acidovorans]OZC22501.1 hypothetical protein SPACI_13390 [Sporomusa acidovorans DSM 3132]SDE73477.1 hypothetical protein SAMN04488499_102040 [Sporomusa acidovorans]